MYSFFSTTIYVRRTGQIDLYPLRLHSLPRGSGVSNSQTVPLTRVGGTESVNYNFLRNRDARRRGHCSRARCVTFHGLRTSARCRRFESDDGTRFAARHRTCPRGSSSVMCTWPGPRSWSVASSRAAGTSRRTLLPTNYFCYRQTHGHLRLSPLRPSPPRRRRQDCVRWNTCPPFPDTCVLRRSFTSTLPSTTVLTFSGDFLKRKRKTLKKKKKTRTVGPTLHHHTRVE